MISFLYKPGTYKYYTISDGIWGETKTEGSVIITSNNCTLTGILKKTYSVRKNRDKPIEVDKNKQNKEYIDLAYKYLSAGNTDLFLRYSMAAIRQGWDDAEIYYDRGSVYENMKKYKEAKTEYKIAIKKGYRKAEDSLKRLKK